MITNWQLCNFKSARNHTDLNFAPLTIFAGANSSGKSTILQSILLTAQTIQSSVHGKSVVLNGHIVRLGGFKDIYSSCDANEDIHIGFSLAPNHGQDSALNAARLMADPFSYTSHDIGANTQSVNCSFSFSNRGDGVDAELLELQPKLIHSNISINTLNADGEGDPQINIKRSTHSQSERAQELLLPNEPSISPEYVSLEYEINEPKNFRAARRLYRGYDLPQNAKYAGAVMSHFLPLRLTIAYDAVEEDVRRQISNLLNYREARFHSEGESKWLQVNVEFRNKLISLLEDVAKNLPNPDTNEHERRRLTAFIETLIKEFTFRNYIFLLQSTRNETRSIILNKITESIPSFKEFFRAGRPAEYVIRYAPPPPLVSLAVDYIKNYFSLKLKYLGPLRDEPKPVYPLAGSTDPKDVGFKGEHTAAVLDIHRNTMITYIPTEVFSNKSEHVYHKTVTLIDAVADWLNYMGVVSVIRTADRGKLGHELKVATTNSPNTTMHDLTHVGVGVSQILPILVLSLIAESDTTLIFEQPELHLHPKVQTRLADFFVSLMHLNKQCLVETHSEYLINRLRLLAASSADNRISKDSILYFVEKEDDQSRYSPIKINEYGAIPLWPKGFFDEGESIAAETLKAAIQKNRRQKQK